MPKFFLSVVCIMIIFSQDIFAQIVNIPDPNFKAALLNQSTPVIDTNGDDEIQVSEALATTVISAVSNNISDITGIEAFVNLESLNCFNNPINEVDLSQNTSLNVITFTFSNLTEIDLSSNNDLFSVSLSNSPINEINVSNLTNLEVLNLNSTNVSSIDVSNNLNLLFLDLFFTNVQSLDVTNNDPLEYLSISGTQISDFDFSILPNLKILGMRNTDFENVDLSSNSQLCNISIRNCPQLTSINIQNGNNPALAQNQPCVLNFTFGGTSITSGLFANTGNSSLEFICVDDIIFAEDNFLLVLPQVEFLEDCSSLSTDTFASSVVTIYPNPVVDVLEISSPQLIEDVEIFSVTGARVYKAKSDGRKMNLDVEALSPGIYFLSLKSDTTENQTIKFVKK